MRKRNKRGSHILEFTMVGIPVVFLIYATVELSIAMWNYHTLAYAVNEAARYAARKGQGCSTNGNSCGTTVGAIATQIESAAIGVPAGSVNVTLTTASGHVTPCSPLNSCLSNSTAWPPSANSDNVPGKNISISAQYVFSSGVTVLWPGAGRAQIGAIVLPAVSTQPIVF